jgi:hypothetical protein
LLVGGKAAFCSKVEHLASGHTAHARCAREERNERDTRFSAGIELRKQFEGERLERVARQDRRGFVEGAMRGRPAAAQIVVVHGRQVVMDERVTMNALQSRAGCECRLLVSVKQRGGFDDEERPEALASGGGMPHRLDQALRFRRFTLL